MTHLEKYKFKNRFPINEAKRREITLDNVVSYGIDFIDTDYIGILPHELIVVGADSGVGKSAFATNLAVTNINRGKKVMYFALEGGDEDIHHRIIGSLMKDRGIGYKRYRYNLEEKVTEEVMQEIYDGLGDLGENLGIYYFEGSLPGLRDLIEEIDRLKDEVDLFIIDHLHYINFQEERDEYKAINEIMDKLKAITKMTNTPIVLVSHTRGHSYGHREEPTEYDLHGSSNIAKQADVVLMISRIQNPDDYELDDRYTEDPNFSRTRIAMRKHRILGFRKTYGVAYNIREQRYIEITKTEPLIKIKKDKLFSK